MDATLGSCVIHESKVYSQHGEDGVIASVFRMIGTTNKFFVEIGCESGIECNTRLLFEQGWHGFCLEANYGDGPRHIIQHRVTVDNVADLMTIYGCPWAPDFFSLDIDSNDWHVLQAVLRRFRPVLICAEYNGTLGPDLDATVPPSHTVWDSTTYFGASYRAFVNLGRRWNYRCIYCENSGANLFLLRGDRAGDTPEGEFKPLLGIPQSDEQCRTFLPSSGWLI